MSAQHQIEALLQQASEGRALEILTRALEDLPVGIGILSVPDLTFVYSNPMYESWFRQDRRPIVGKRLEQALVAAPHVAGIFRQAASSGERVHFANAEFVGLKNRPTVLPGDITRWDWGIWPLKDRTGRVTHLLVSGIDVTATEVDRRRVAHAHEEGIQALLEVSRTAGTAGSIEDFFAQLSATVARLVGARCVLFARLSGGVLVPQLHAHGLPDELLAPLSVPCSAEGDGIIDRIVFQDEVFKAAVDTSPRFEPYRAAIQAMGISDAVAVMWRAGDLRLGLVAAMDSRSEAGFSDEDVQILKTASMAAGVVWQHREAQERLAEAQREESERLQRNAERTAALERAKADFLRMASHEMRGPLTVVRGYMSMLHEGALGEMSPRAGECLRVVSDKIDELARMVDQMLEAARLEDRSLELNLTTFDIRELIPLAVNEARLVATPAHSLQVEVDPEPIYVRADRSRIQMIIGNLLDNAIKYSPAGGEVRCSVQRAGANVAVVVSDQGMGIDALDLPLLFKRFGRVGESSGIPGTGLGLYLCREAARLHGGDVTVSSRVGEGSRFTFEMPVTPPT